MQQGPQQRPVHDLSEYLTQVTGSVVDEPLLVRALTHRSFAYEHGGAAHNERLEFLGDAVLGIVITDALFRDNPDLTEGQLAKLRAAVVNSRALAQVATSIDLGAYLRLGRGEECTGGRQKASILADTTEAVIGAVYLTGGLPAATVFVHHLLDPLLASTAQLGAGLDWKTSLQELTAALGHGTPEYRVTDVGPDHDKTFTAHLLVAGEELGSGVGRSKKEAEQKAAQTAWEALEARRVAAEAGSSQAVQPSSPL